MSPSRGTGNCSHVLVHQSRGYSGRGNEIANNIQTVVQNTMNAGTIISSKKEEMSNNISAAKYSMSTNRSWTSVSTPLMTMLSEYISNQSGSHCLTTGVTEQGLFLPRSDNTLDINTEVCVHIALLPEHDLAVFTSHLTTPGRTRRAARD